MYRMRFLLSVTSLVLVLAACGSSKDLVAVADPDVFEIAAVDAFTSTTAYTYSFQGGGASGDIGSIANAAHTLDPLRSRVNGEITSFGETTTGEIYFLEDGTVLSRSGLGPFVTLDESVEDVIWLDAIHQAISESAQEFDYVADETVAGRTASHFTGPPIFPAPLVAEQLAAQLGLEGGFEGSTDVWIDAAGLVLKFEMEATADNGDAFVTVTAAVRINNLGGAVAIAPPDEGLIIHGNVLADDRAKTNLNNVLIAARLFYTGDETYSGLSAPDLTAREPSVSYVDGTTVETAGTVGFLADEDRILLTTLSETGTWFCVVEDRATEVVTFGGGASNDLAGSFEDCSNPVWPPSSG